MDYENPKTIDFTVHESIMARMERANKRWFIAWLVQDDTGGHNRRRWRCYSERSGR